LCCAVGLLLLATGRSSGEGPAAGDVVKVYRAADILPRELLRGPNYEIEPEVALRGYWYDFRLKTEWGVLPARGMGMLEVRIREMHAVERARKMSRDPQFV